MPFSPTQQEAIDIRNKNVIVSASAGSGKTSVLVQRLCTLVINDRISIDRILAMTFTNDAAAEMKDRLKKSLAQKQSEHPEDVYLKNQLTLLETASICTIDSFCQSIVKNFYYKIPISFTMAQTVGSEAQLNTAMENAYNRAILQIDLNQYTDLVHFFKAYGQNEQNIQQVVQSIINVANSKSDKEQWYQSVIQNYSEWDEMNLKYFFLSFENKIKAMIDILDYLMEEISYIDFKKESDYTSKLSLFQNKKDHLIACLPYLENKDYPGFKLAFKAYVQSAPNVPGKINKIDFTTIAKDYKTYQESITNILFDLSVFEADRNKNQPVIETLIKICSYCDQFYLEEKKKIEVIDFNDMEHFALSLLSDPAIQQEYRERYITILVDEFQDTNELQEAIISKFARENNTFRVGDIKQSIYGFRQAKPEIMKNHMNSVSPLDQTLVLKENYRSNASIIEFNNDFYQKIMNSELLGSQFSDIDLANVGRDEQKSSVQYPVRFLYTEQDSWSQEQEEKINAMKVKSIHERNRYDLIANDILSQIKEGHSYSEICILLRSRNKQDECKSCLEAYGIPVYASVNSGFFTNSAIQIVLSCLIAFMDPDDDIHLMAALCSPLFNITYEQCAMACIQKEKNISLWNQIKNQEFMKPFIQCRNESPVTVGECIKSIYQINDFYYAHTSSHDKTNLDYLLERATLFPDQMDKIHFLEQLEEASRLDRTGEVSSVGKEDNVVRIMTMHGSKGLQFPIVYILSSHSTNTRFESGPVLVDSDLGIALGTCDHIAMTKRASVYQIAMKEKKLRDDLMEEMRILYVASTRAEKQLIFVDTIKNEKEYATSLNTWALLKRKSYTSWLFHTYFDKDPLVQFEKESEIYQTPTKENIDHKADSILLYTNETTEISSLTASATKEKLEWKPFTEDLSSASYRGTLFHEMAGNCSYPYQKEEIIAYAKERNYIMSGADCNQFLSLNTDALYQKYMSYPHQFELSYIIQQENTIVHGFMDLVINMEDRNVILDFKTDTVENDQQLIDLYHKQLETYRDSYLQIDASKPIELVLYSFHLKKCIYLKR